MTVTTYFRYPKTIRRLHEGPLGTYIDFYAEQLIAEGHCLQSGGRCIRVVGQFSLWLAGKHLDVGDVNEQTVDQYQRFRAKYRKSFLSELPALKRLLNVLRRIDAISPAATKAITPLEQIEQDFEHFLLHERGLCQVSVIRHRTPLRKFLQEYCAQGVASFSRLTSADITQFVVRHAHDQSPRSGHCMCWTIRAFTRYLLFREYVATDLSTAVPSIRTWRFSTLPEHLSTAQVQQVLDGCDRSSSIGKRDYAVLLLLARLGLRANEVAMLRLVDIDWHTSRLMVRGKGRQNDWLPLLDEVGAAFADYLQHGRPPTTSGRVFVRSLAPHTQFASSAGISELARAALRRAGLDVRHQGAHLFRHSLATRMLRKGASLSEIGQVLRHQDHDTTRLYAKVDIDALRKLGLSWPGGAQ